VTLLDTCDNIFGRSFCALGDGATSPIVSGVQLFREEFLAHITGAGCPFDPVAWPTVMRSLLPWRTMSKPRGRTGSRPPAGARGTRLGRTGSTT
ncbi:MAG: hypothetical protein M3445_01500, partial [Actinomycetota bacterium]|nr:hypothetical protein [Actinomycetota bacterium]